MPLALQGFDRADANIEASAAPLDRRLSMVTATSKSKQLERETQLSGEEIQNIKRFYDREVRGREAKYIHRVMQLMFRDVQNDTLRKKYFVSGGVACAKTQGFEYFVTLAQVFCKGVDEEDKLTFFFDLFSGFKPRLTRAAARDFCEIFELE